MNENTENDIKKYMEDSVFNETINEMIKNIAKNTIKNDKKLKKAEYLIEKVIACSYELGLSVGGEGWGETRKRIDDLSYTREKLTSYIESIIDPNDEDDLPEYQKELTPKKDGREWWEV